MQNEALLEQEISRPADLNMGLISVDRAEDEGFRRLAAATVWKAVEDAAGEDEQVAYSAIRWLSGDTVDGLTLERCCQFLGIEPCHVRNGVSRRFEEIRARMARYHRVRMLSARTYGNRIA